VSIGLLLNCFSVREDGLSYSVVRPLDSMGENLLNEYDCPILTMSNLVYCIPSTSVLYPVSVVHECNNSCVFVSGIISRAVEHEKVDSAQLCYHHDWSNNMYSLNIFCMSV
jgi:hypothetical protein